MPIEVRVVFDCNVFWKAFFSRTGNGYWCYRLITDGKVRHFVSLATVDELVSVLSREETLLKFPEFELEDVEEFVRYVVSISNLERNVPHAFELPRDVDDGRILISPSPSALNI